MLGYNYHLRKPYDQLHKQTELEILYNDILNLEAKNKITVKSTLKPLLLAEGYKHRCSNFKSTLPKKLLNAASQLRKNTQIIIRKADKSPTYVILNRDNYFSKLNTILSDSSKFQKVKADPTVKIRSKLNKIIATLIKKKITIFSKIIGDYKPGYIYGNVKIHKKDNSLRPIISQCPAVTYNVAKEINKIISPYCPSQYSLKSSYDFVDLIHSNGSSNIIASLDVESLFTNVPVIDTINIICKCVYSHPSIQPPQISPEVLKELLYICTTQSPFLSPNGDLYV